MTEPLDFPSRRWGGAAGTGAALFLAAAAVVAATGLSVRAGEMLPGPVRARVIEVVDGDTLAVRARVWLGQEVEVRVRLAGVDTPELRGACGREKALAGKARALVAARVAGAQVILRDIRYGKYAGRVLARVETADGEDLGAALTAAGLARAYAGGRRAGWCATSEAHR